MLTSVFDRLYSAIGHARDSGATCPGGGSALDVAVEQIEEAQRCCQGLATPGNAARALAQLNLAADQLRGFEGEVEESDRAVAELRAALTEALQGLALATSAPAESVAD